jgi:hypothetical protein
MTDFGELVTDINKANGNGAAARTHNDDELARQMRDAWFRKELLPTIARFISAQVRPLRQRIEELENKTKHWEYRGTFESGETYYENNFVTHQGSLWACRCNNTSAVPGTDATWQLCVKRGRAAR